VDAPLLPSLVESLGPLSEDKIEKFLRSLSPEEATTIASSWSVWNLPYQRLPEGTWRRWLLRCGRGAGKTHTGARTVNEIARDRSKIRTGEIGIIGRTLQEARMVMVEGPSGILATAPANFRPLWEPGKSTLTWPNQVKARLFSADKPEQMRGPNWAAVWADEPAHWPDAEATWWTVIEPALRIGWARAVLTSTPIRDSFLRDLEDKEGTVVTRASTFDNPFLKRDVRQGLLDQFEGTSIGRQELLGEYLTDAEGALWSQSLIDRGRVSEMPSHAERMRVVVAVDPAVTANEKSDETGIIVAALGSDGHAYILQDRSLKGTPGEWGRVAVAAYHRWQADSIVVEVNNGGDLVESNVRAVDDSVAIRQVRASRGKVMRAEPALALYERGKVHHVRRHPVLEDQMVTWEPARAQKAKSPDRLDALVWALFDLILEADQPAGDIRGYL
jgi:phage terminase large subunit-like protein